MICRPFNSFFFSVWFLPHCPRCVLLFLISFFQRSLTQQLSTTPPRQSSPRQPCRLSTEPKTGDAGSILTRMYLPRIICSRLLKLTARSVPWHCTSIPIPCVELIFILFLSFSIPPFPSLFFCLFCALFSIANQLLNMHRFCHLLGKEEYCNFTNFRCVKVSVASNREAFDVVNFRCPLTLS